MKLLSYVAIFWLSFYLEPATAGSIWKDIWGDPAPDSFYAGMWSYHISPNSRHHEHAENDLLMGVYKGYFAGTLINSYDDRMYAAGIQRNWVQKSYTSCPHNLRFLAPSYRTDWIEKAARIVVLFKRVFQSKMACRWDA